MLFIMFLFLVHYGLFFEFNSKATIFEACSNFEFYLSILNVSALNVIVDYTEKAYNSFFKKSILNTFEKNMENKEIILNASKIVQQLHINNSNNNNISNFFDIKNDNLKSPTKVNKKNNDSSLECLNLRQYQSIG